MFYLMRLINHENLIKTSKGVCTITGGIVSDRIIEGFLKVCNNSCFLQIKSHLEMRTAQWKQKYKNVYWFCVSDRYWERETTKSIESYAFASTVSACDVGSKLSVAFVDELTVIPHFVLVPGLSCYFVVGSVVALHGFDERLFLHPIQVFVQTIE